MPRVSVVVPTYNCARFLDRGLRSITQQTYTDYEIVVADDGSTDETEEVVGRYAPRARHVRQANRGVSAARNLALAHASGELIAHMDSDDLWHPAKLERQVAYLDAQPAVDLVHSEVAVVDEDDRVLHARFNAETARPVPEGRCLDALLRRCHIQVSAVLERRSCVERTGPFDERLRAAEDYFRWILAAMAGASFGYLDEPLAMYRWRQGSLFQSRAMSESYVTLFELLLSEKQLEARCGAEAARVARSRLFVLARSLAYLDRSQGRRALARQGILRLIRRWPYRTEPYLDLVRYFFTPRGRSGVPGP